jgi:xanthine dehydrogenase accessory factor
MAFADAWFDGIATLDGVEARRADVNGEFILGLSTRQFIPLLTQPFIDVSGRWPWDVIVSVQADGEPSFENISGLAGLTLGLGQSYAAGVNCDAVIEMEGPDPGGIVRSGRVPARRQVPADQHSSGRVLAPASGVFAPTKLIGAVVAAGEAFGAIGETLVIAPAAGRIRGAVRKGQAVVKGAMIADLTTTPGARVAGITKRNRLISRGVAFAVEMEAGGWEPVLFETWR